MRKIMKNRWNCKEIPGCKQTPENVLRHLLHPSSEPGSKISKKSQEQEWIRIQGTRAHAKAKPMTSGLDRLDSLRSNITNWCALCLRRLVALGHFTVHSWSTEDRFACRFGFIWLMLCWRSVELYWALSLCTSNSKDFLLGASPFSYEESMGHGSVAA